MWMHTIVIVSSHAARKDPNTDIGREGSAGPRRLGSSDRSCRLAWSQSSALSPNVEWERCTFAYYGELQRPMIS
jgi:hypothetical protein